jgi:pimeloyl-ACP methyl ester carboxylesterase
VVHGPFRAQEAALIDRRSSAKRLAQTVLDYFKQMNRLGTILAITAGMSAGGCASYQTSGSARAALPLPPEIQQYYEYASNAVSASVTTVEQHPAFSVKEVALSVTGSRWPIRIQWFAPKTSGRRPLILISPIKGSDTVVVDGCARAFANSGYHAAIIKRARFDFDPTGPLSQVEDTLHTAVIRHREALDWLLAQRGVDTDRVATFGISYGAIITAVLAAVEPRVKICVLDLAGGPIAGVMKSSEERSLRRNWDRSRSSHDLTNKELYKALGDVIRTDPVKLAPYVARDRVLMLIARFDSSVPTRYQIKLWRALGKPRADFVPLGHYTSILVLPAHRLSVMKFFEDNFERPVLKPAAPAVQAKN